MENMGKLDDMISEKYQKMFKDIGNKRSEYFKQCMKDKNDKEYCAKKAVKYNITIDMNKMNNSFSECLRKRMDSFEGKKLPDNWEESLDECADIFQKDIQGSMDKELKRVQNLG